MNTSKIKKAIAKYIQTYYSYKVEAESYLDESIIKAGSFLFGKKEVKAYLSKDNFISIFSYPANINSFKFEKSDKLNEQIIRQESTFESGLDFTVSFDSNISGSVFLVGILLKNNQTHSVEKPKWDRLQITPIKSISELSLAQAKKHAEKDYETIILNKTFNLGLSKEEIFSKPNITFEFIKNKAIEFRKLLDANQDANESVFHEYLFEYPFLINRDADIEVKSKPRFVYPYGDYGVNNKQYVEPDLIFVLPRDRYILVELETPSKQFRTSSGQQRAEITQSEFQLNEWEDYIEKYGYSELKSTFPSIHSKTSRSYKMIISRDKNFGSLGNKKKWINQNSSLKSTNVEILTYDDIINDTIKFCNKYLNIS